MSFPFRPSAVACAAAVAFAAHAQETVTITGSLVERAVADAPFAIGVVGREALRDAGAQINLSEVMARVPGIVVANRSNFAQDLQITSRGYGARATFGVRGIRLYTDGIPASGPDGQGQVSQFDLAGAERVEVLRGPFSSIYGNSSGGVIAIFTAPVKRNEVEGEFASGSFGLRQLRGSIATQLGGGMDLRVSASTMSIEGFRPESEAKRRTLNARLGWQQGADRVVVLGNIFSQPAQDPLGLTQQQFDQNPYQTTPEATQFDTRKTQTQRQLGAIWTHRFDAGALRESSLMGYASRRSVAQYLAINNGTQGTPGTSRHGGALLDFDRATQGLEAKLRFGWTDLELQVGAALDDQRDDRQGYENYLRGVTPIVYGVQGQLRRDEINRAGTRDVFAQAEWAFARDWLLTGGLRHGRVTLESEDRYVLAPNNGDDSGSKTYSYTNPALGLRWQAAPGWNVYASVARGHESPTLNEILYRVDNVAGLNFDLQAQTSRQVELGTKWRSGRGHELDLALFETRTDDEIGVVLNAGGRAAFKNVGRTLRRGFELGAGMPLGGGVTARVAYTFLDATYRDNFDTCRTLPCNPNATPPQNVETARAGNRIAGTQRHNGYAELAWDAGTIGRLGAELRGVSSTQANDVNDAAAPKYAVANLRWSLPLFTGGELLARVDNVFDRRYAGSVIVNESNRRFFEPGAPRSLLLALRVTTGF